MKSKERLTEVEISFDERTEIHGYRVTGDTIEFIGKDGVPLVPAYAAVGSGYERGSGKFKSTSRMPVDPNRISADFPVTAKQYDELYAVDTNSTEIDGHKICVCCSARLEFKFTGLRWDGNGTLQDAFVFCNPRHKPELIGWIDFLERMQFDTAKSVGVAVDSELGLLGDYNLRREEIIKGYRLQENVTLIYASSDLDQNIPFNYAIAQCDANSKLLIRKMQSDRSHLKKLIQSASSAYERHFYWKVQTGNPGHARGRKE